jgi:hypothetical protein
MFVFLLLTHRLENTTHVLRDVSGLTAKHIYAGWQLSYWGTPPVTWKQLLQEKLYESKTGEHQAELGLFL